MALSPDVLAVINKLIALAVRKLCDFGLPIENWTHRELAEIANSKNIAPGISRRTVGRILEECNIKPHKSKYWENPKIDNENDFRKTIKNICSAYRNAPDNLISEIHTVCIDEKTGIQALERIFPDIPATPDCYKRLEFEYIRHGTQSLIAGFEVGNGKVIKAHVGKTRNEKDFANFVDDTIKVAPDDQWIFIVDRLNSHMSETLVSLVAKHIRFKGDLGIKQHCGIQKTLASREKFLSNPQNRIHFIYTPKHCSWMNQIEIWFGILTRKALKRSSFSSLKELRKRIFDFIDFFNKTMARAFNLTYKGRALKA